MSYGFLGTRVITGIISRKQLNLMVLLRVSQCVIVILRDLLNQKFTTKNISTYQNFVCTLCCHLLSEAGCVKQTSKSSEICQSTNQTYFNSALNSPKAGKRSEALYQYKSHLITLNNNISNVKSNCKFFLLLCILRAKFTH